MKKIILFGSGEWGVKALRLFTKDNVVCFCNNDRSLDGTTIEGVPVVFAERIGEYYDEQVTDVVIASCKLENVIEMSKQLDGLKIPFRLLEDVAREYVRHEKDYYSKNNTREEFNYCKDREYLFCWDRFKPAGSITSYFWQDLWAAKRIQLNPVDVHYDIGSRLDGFIAHLVSFGQNVCMIDVRPLPIRIDGVDFVEADATNLQGIEDESIESLSALCSLEHFGLGRYGDPIDPEACFKCFDSITRKLKSGGNLYISVPIGKECLCFNAHRVFYAETILKEFVDMTLVEFSTCFETEFEENVRDIHKYDDWFDRQGDRMGLFWFRKK